ncbi:glutamate receptor 3.5-like [Arachis stenosperma]|uniref:glutamate receptor 3.5-like n=1 Tax=Arachis stenosperma TaxID=217475 RepID=UPI0025AC3A9B|nr:glutamate receptor 3.5-like [Arachis stenosperma]
MENDVVAVIGPQSSGIAHLISNVVNELHVPLLSFATDPSLSSLQYPYFIRTMPSDCFQLVDYYQWREVIAIYVDDDNGRNGISVLGNALAKKRAKISYKAAFPPGAAMSDISDLLNHVNLMESRIYVLHVNPDSGLSIFYTANKLGMISSGYVWIATDWLPSVLDSMELAVNDDTTNLLQGVVALRHHTPDTDFKKSFISQLKSRYKNLTAGINSYALYGYDSVCLAAHSLDAFLNEGGNISFSCDTQLHGTNASMFNFSLLRMFDQGDKFLQTILRMNFTGVSGLFKFDTDKNLIHPAYDIIRRRIGYWSNYSSLSVIAPEILYLKPPNTSTSSRRLYSVIWPGETTDTPKGWVFPKFFVYQHFLSIRTFL